MVTAPSIARQAHPQDAAERGRQLARLKRFDTRRASLRAIAPGVSGFQGLTLFLGGMIAAAPRAAIASWHLRASKAGWLRHCSQNVGRVCLSAQPQIMAGSNQPYGDCRQSPIGQRIVSEPRCLSAALQAGQFRVLQARAAGLLMQPGYHTGFTR